MLRARDIVIFVLTSILLCTGGVRAEQKPPLRLTLRDAVRLALTQSPQVQIGNLNVALRDQDSAIARSALLPEASLETFDSATRRNLEAFIGTRLPGIPQHVGPFQTFQSGLAFSIPVFDLTLWRRLQAARQGVRESRAQELAVREQTTLLVVSQYLGSLRAAAEVRAAKSRVRLAQVLYDQAIELQKQGVGTRIDTLRANVQLQNEHQTVIVAETQEKTALHGLVRLLNLDPREGVELSDELSFFEMPQFEAGPSLDRALATRPEMKALLSHELTARFLKRASNESRLPKVNVGGDWAYQGLSLAAFIPSYQYQVTVEIPLIAGGRIRAENAKANLELKKIAQEKQDLNSQIVLEVRTAIDQLDSARNEVRVANLGVKLAKQEIGQAQERFKAGASSNIEVTTAQDSLARADNNQIGALYRYNQARADLARAMGQIEDLYTK